jgi:hypothetical protein
MTCQSSHTSFRKASLHLTTGWVNYGGGEYESSRVVGYLWVRQGETGLCRSFRVDTRSGGRSYG